MKYQEMTTRCKTSKLRIQNLIIYVHFFTRISPHLSLHIIILKCFNYNTGQYLFYRLLLTTHFAFPLVTFLHNMNLWRIQLIIILTAVQLIMFYLQLPFNAKSQSLYFNFQIYIYYSYISVYTQITLR